MVISQRCTIKEKKSLRCAGKPCQYCFSGGQFEALTKRGIIPSASVWIPFGKPVNGSMKPPSLDYYRRVKEMLADLYIKYDLEPAGCCGLNVCVEKDIWRWARGV